MAHTSRRFPWAMAAAALMVTGCGGSSEPGAATAPPSRSGQVWEIQGDDRAYNAGSIVAFVNGVHVMVVDGDRIYAGMTELTTKSGTGGAKTITFASGLSAEMVPSGQGAEMRFSTGERVPVHTRAGE